MQERARKALRILALQQLLHRNEDWKLLNLERRRAGLKTAEQDLIEALNEDQALHGLFVDAMARRLRSLAEEANRLTDERAGQSARLVQQTGRLRLAERLTQTLQQAATRAEDQAEIVEIIERFIARAKTSLP